VWHVTRELASKAGVAPDTIWRIEGGDYKKLRPSTMRKIAEALGVHPAEIAEFVREDHVVQ
jgi:DNA-binding Xre family transcriptional regulator